MAGEPPYTLGRPEHRGSVLGWRPGQALAVALGDLGFLFGLSLRGADGEVLDILAAVAGCVVAMVTFHGRGLDEWAPVLVGHLVRVRGGAWAPGEGNLCERVANDTTSGSPAMIDVKRGH